ncbi:MAG: hypothetical protein VXZ15_01795, partial [Planctomycetota bacterium]|nr:hypothetical protein [Planctomycetota bacterium]
RQCRLPAKTFSTAGPNGKTGQQRPVSPLLSKVNVDRAPSPRGSKVRAAAEEAVNETECRLRLG